MARMFAIKFSWLSTTPFGSPVLPEVYCINAVSFGEGIGNAPCEASSHPSPLSCYKKYKSFPSFCDSKPFTKINNELSEKIGLKTSILFNQEGSSGSITLYYSDLDQLDDIMRRLKK